jgi:hypothetical protein
MAPSGNLSAGDYVPTYTEVLDAFTAWLPSQSGEPQDLVADFLGLVGLT